MDPIPIQSGIPIPPVEPPMKYPLPDMKVGDSFFLPRAKVKRIRGRIYSAAARRKMRVTLRQFTQDGSSGVMIWRIG
jgi:hypothetical protein